MGVVYEAIDSKNKSHVALKLLKDSDPASIYRLKWEFRSLAQMYHRNLVQLYELISEGDQWFFTMELIDSGRDFISYLRGKEIDLVVRDATTLRSKPDYQNIATPLPGPSPITTAAITPKGGHEPTQRLGRVGQIVCPITDFDRLREVMRQLCVGVSELHRNHRMHRDLKPGNALIDPDGRVVLLDFGLVKEMESEPQRALHATPLGETSYGQIIGTAGYMAPEQAAGLRLSPASDWYSVGVMLFEAITGRLPFTGTSASVLRDKQRLDPPMPSDFASGIPGDLESLCLSLLRREPDERATGEDALSMLDAKPETRKLNTTRVFIGRQQQMSSLTGALAAARQGATVVCHLQGLSGSGKSTLVDRFLKQAKAEGALVLSGRCYENELVPFKAMDALVDSLTSYLVQHAHRAGEEAAAAWHRRPLAHVPGAAPRTGDGGLPGGHRRL